MSDAPVCPETGDIMRRDTRPMTLTYKGERVTFDMPGWYCDHCGESIHTGKDMKISDRILNRLKSKCEGLLSPEEIRKIRLGLGLSQVEAGLIIGGGPRAFQKYESADLAPSRAIHSALVLLARDPNALELLKKKPPNKSCSRNHNQGLRP
jgi:HTH-type transcriptional regulator / antitoxin MqsA